MGTFFDPSAGWSRTYQLLTNYVLGGGIYWHSVMGPEVALVHAWVKFMYIFRTTP